MQNIILVGFSGCGKTTIGRKVANRLDLQFVDLDDAVEGRYHIDITGLFRRYGESIFRECEHNVLKEVLQMKGIVLSTGGGTPCYKNTMDLLNANGITVYIKMTAPLLVQRLLHAKKSRPLISELDENALTRYVQQTLTLREPYYRQAIITVEGRSFDLMSAIEAIRTHL